jgi:hypothetical protein
MKPILTNWTIVLVGNWNSRIFTPNWVGQQLFEGGKIQLEVPIQAMSFLRYNTKDLLLIPQDDRLIIGVKTTKDEIFQGAENIARKVLGLLPHTPIRSFGINFGFLEEDPSSELLSLFKLYDNDKLSDGGFDLVETEIKRTLPLEMGVLNLTFTFGKEKGDVKIHLNFHHKTETASIAQEKLDNRSIWCRNFALGFLHDIYQLTMEEGE